MLISIDTKFEKVSFIWLEMDVSYEHVSSLKLG